MRYLVVLSKKGNEMVWESDNFRSILGLIRTEVRAGARVEKFIDTSIREPGDRKTVLWPLDRIRYDYAMAEVTGQPQGDQSPYSMAFGLQRD